MIRLALLTCAFLAPLLIARQGRDYKMFAAQIIAIASLAGLIFWRPGNARKFPAILSGYAVPLVWLAGLLVTMMHSHHASATDELVRQAVFFSLFPLSALFMKKSDDSRLTWIWMGAFIFVGAYAVMQRMGLEPVADFRKWNPQDRVFATFGNPDFLGAFCAFLLPLFIDRLFNSRFRPWWIFMSGFTALILYWTFSRGAWLGAGAGVAVWGTISLGWQGIRRRLPVIIILVAAFMLTASLLGLLPWNTLFRRTDRVQLWKGSCAMLAQKPLGGWGLGSFAAEFPPFAPVEFSARMKADNTFAEHPHCEYLHVAVESGIVGLGIFAWLLVWLAATFLRATRLPGGKSLAGPLGALSAILVHIMVDRNFRLASTAVPFWIMSGVLLAQVRGGAGKTPPSSGGGIYRGLAASSTAILAVLLVFRPLTASLKVGLDKDFLDQKADIPLAELEAERAVKSGDPVWQIMVGNAYAQEKRFGPAATAFAEALHLDPRNVSAANNLGNSYFMMSRFDDAIRAYEKALAIDPAHKDARFNMAYAYFHKRDIKRALAECDILLKMDPTYFKAIQLKSQLAP